MPDEEPLADDEGNEGNGEMQEPQCDTDVLEANVLEDAGEASLPSPGAIGGEVTDPFGNYMEDLPAWLQRKASSGQVLTTEPSEDQRYAAVLSAALAEVTALREQLAVQAAVSQQAKEDAANATAAATAAKAELLAFQMTIQRERTGSMSSASSAASSIAPLPLLAAHKSASKEASAASSAASAGLEGSRKGKETETAAAPVEVEVQLTMRDALDELSSISDKWDVEERDVKATLKKRGSDLRVPIDELSTLIDAKLAAAQYAFERDEATQRSRRLRSELDHVLSRVRPAEEIATGAP
jgi:hypothetical protein